MLDTGFCQNYNYSVIFSKKDDNYEKNISTKCQKKKKETWV